jgi:hypothetical protein
LNDAWLSEDNEDEAIEVDELEEEEEGDWSEHVPRAEPTKMKHLVQRYAALNEHQSQQSLLGLSTG